MIHRVRKRKRAPKVSGARRRENSLLWLHNLSLAVTHCILIHNSTRINQIRVSRMRSVYKNQLSINESRLLGKQFPCTQLILLRCDLTEIKVVQLRTVDVGIVR